MNKYIVNYVIDENIMAKTVVSCNCAGAEIDLLGDNKKAGILSIMLVESNINTSKGVKYESLTNTINICISVCNSVFQTNFGFEKIKSRSRKREVLYIRHCIAVYVKKHHALMPLSRIGILLGGRDHSTVINSIKTWEALSFKTKNIQKINALLIDRLGKK